VPTDYRVSTRFCLIAVLSIVVVLAGCRRVAPDLGPTLQPTPTYTPRSTPLPTVATPPPPGTEDNPIVMIFTDVRASRAQIAEASDAVSAALLENAAISVEIDVVERGADAVSALCSSPAGPVTVAWLDGVAYASALAQNCGTPELFIERADGVGAQVVIVVPDNSTANSITDLQDGDFCRLGVSDVYSWLVPALMMQASGLTPTALRSITDYDDAEALLAAVEDGECDAAGISSADLADVGADVQELPQNAVVPHAVLMMPASLPLGARDALENALLTLAGDPETAQVLSPLLDQTRIIQLVEGDLDGWDQFIAATRLNFAAAGN
jgi:ABC-type phosphate/phosphonate transport system substrate-binding protein